MLKKILNEEKGDKQFDIKYVGLLGVVVNLFYAIYSIIKNLTFGIKVDFDLIRQRKISFARQNFSLAIKMLKRGKFSDALFRLHLTKFFHKDYKKSPLIYYYYAKAYYSMGKIKKSMSNLYEFINLEKNKKKIERANSLLIKIEQSIKFKKK